MKRTTQAEKSANRKDDTGGVGGASEDAWGAGFFRSSSAVQKGRMQKKRFLHEAWRSRGVCQRFPNSRVEQSRRSVAKLALTPCRVCTLFLRCHTNCVWNTIFLNRSIYFLY